MLAAAGAPEEGTKAGARARTANWNQQDPPGGGSMATATLGELSPSLILQPSPLSPEAFTGNAYQGHLAKASRGPSPSMKKVHKRVAQSSDKRLRISRPIYRKMQRTSAFTI